MSSPFVAEIRMFGFNFPPVGWAFCNGQIMSISQNTALFSLLGTTYGGDGKSNFALPNLMDSCAIHPGQGAGLSLRVLGETGGEPAVTLLQSEMPAHNHSVNVEVNRLAVNPSPDPSQNIAKASGGAPYGSTAPDTQMSFQAIGVTGGSLPHNNMQPYVTLNYCIALQGIFPARN